MQTRSDQWTRLIGAAIAAGLFYVGTAIVLQSGDSITPSAEAQLIAPSLTQQHEDVLITSSPDGKTLYLWTFGHAPLLDTNRFPTFQCEVPAVYSDD